MNKVVLLIRNLGRPGFWKLAVEQLGLEEELRPATFQTSTFASAVALASRGAGVAVLPYMTARAALAAGDLVALFGDIGPGNWVLTISDESLLKSRVAQDLHHALITLAEQVSQTIALVPQALPPWHP